jgi:hypothetical protein
VGRAFVARHAANDYPNLFWAFFYNVLLIGGPPACWCRWLCRATPSVRSLWSQQPALRGIKSVSGGANGWGVAGEMARGHSARHYAGRRSPFRSAD